MVFNYSSIKLKKKTKKLRKLLNKIRIFLEVFYTLFLGMVTVALIYVGNSISKKQTELTELQYKPIPFVEMDSAIDNQPIHITNLGPHLFNPTFKLTTYLVLKKYKYAWGIRPAFLCPVYIQMVHPIV